MEASPARGPTEIPPGRVSTGTNSPENPRWRTLFAEAGPVACNACMKNGAAPSHTAMSNGNLLLVQALLEAGAGPAYDAPVLCKRFAAPLCSPPPRGLGGTP